MGLIATIAALVLGLVIATAKSSYDTQNEAVKYTAAKVLLLDRVLANYGPETKETRNLLRQAIASRVEAIWPQDRSQSGRLVPPQGVLADQGIEARILQLSPTDDARRWLQSQALQIGSDIMQTRWLVFGGLGRSVPVLFLVVVVFWLTIIFGSSASSRPAMQRLSRSYSSVRFRLLEQSS